MSTRKPITKIIVGAILLAAVACIAYATLRPDPYSCAAVARSANWPADICR